jgi:glycosyltransferase involved in cell wall biosynthesis
MACKLSGAGLAARHSESTIFLKPMEPLVSVIIPTYNRADYVVQAVESVLCQTYGNIETIIVDDGSTDNTAEVLSNYQDQINYIYQERSERSKARNEGFRHSKGDYIAFLDSDDAWLPTKVEQQVWVLNEEPNVGLVYAAVKFIDINGAPHCGELWWDEPVRKVLYEDLMTHNVITGSLSTIMVRRECLDRAGLFDESMNICEDLDLYRRIAAHYKFHKIDSVLVKIRIHEDNTQRDLSAMAKGWEATICKISRDTPPEFEYYKNEAIVKLLSKIASLYKQDSRFYSFFSFCIKSVFHRPNWILKYGFWQDVLKLTILKYFIRSNET